MQVVNGKQWAKEFFFLRKGGQLRTVNQQASQQLGEQILQF